MTKKRNKRSMLVEGKHEHANTDNVSVNNSNDNRPRRDLPA